MGARRVLLTHFSQRYQKIPNMDGLDGLEVGLEEAEDDGEGVVADVDVPMADASSVMAGGGKDARSAVTARSPRSADTGADRARVTMKARASVRDMKVGVAFDYMRVKVGEIAHLERFRSALSRLLEAPEAEAEEKGGDEGGKERGQDKTAKKGKQGKEGKRKRV